MYFVQCWMLDSFYQVLIGYLEDVVKLRDYALIISVFVGMGWFWWQAIENLSK